MSKIKDSIIEDEKEFKIKEAEVDYERKYLTSEEEKELTEDKRREEAEQAEEERREEGGNWGDPQE